LSAETRLDAISSTLVKTAEPVGPNTFVQALGLGTLAVNLGGYGTGLVDHQVISAGIASIAFDRGGVDNFVRGGSGPFAIAASIGQTGQKGHQSQTRHQHQQWTRHRRGRRGRQEQNNFFRRRRDTPPHHGTDRDGHKQPQEVDIEADFGANPADRYRSGYPKPGDLRADGTATSPMIVGNGWWSWEGVHRCFLCSDSLP
jgi:hypothetical protein